MAGDNSVTLVGNLVADPELRFTPSGVAMTRIRLAVSRRWMDRASNEWQEESSFFSGTCWAEMAENVAESLQKGNRVVVSGTLQQRSWETEDGERRSMVEIRLEEVAPSLKWATAVVTRTARRDDNFRSDNGKKFATVGAGSQRSGGGGNEDDIDF